MLQRRPYTFAQTNLSPSFFACDKAADHTFRFVRQPTGTRTEKGTESHPVGLSRTCRSFRLFQSERARVSLPHAFPWPVAKPSL